MYVYEEMVNGRKLTEIINNDHENVKYLPGHKLPHNIVAVSDVVETAHDADIIIFVLPHQFMTNTCKPLVGKIKADSFGVSLCKVNIIFIGLKLYCFLKGSKQFLTILNHH